MQDLYVAMFENLFRFVDEVVALGALTPEQMKERAGPENAIKIDSQFTVPESLINEMNSEVEKLTQKYHP